MIFNETDKLLDFITYLQDDAINDSMVTVLQQYGDISLAEGLNILTSPDVYYRYSYTMYTRHKDVFSQNIQDSLLIKIQQDAPNKVNT